MKILFINSSRYDYLQDVVYSGLVKILGSRSVIDRPWNLKYHLPIKKYPKNLGYVGNSLFNIQIITPKRVDAIILGSCKPDVFQAYLSLIDRFPAQTPVIFIDGGDKAEIGGDLARLGSAKLWEKANSKRKIDVIFKREYKLDRVYAKNVHPLPFAWNPSRYIYSPSQKIYDFAFWAAESHPIRSKAFELLRGHFDCDQNGTTEGKNMYTYKRKNKEYLRELSRVKINLSLRGGGFDTLRYYEIPAVESLLISEPPDILIPNNFVDQKSAVFCQSDLSDLLELGEYYLKHEDIRNKISSSGFEHLMKYHTDVHRAEKILTELNLIS